MRRLIIIALLTLAVFPTAAQNKAPAEAELKQLLADFLAAASHSPVTAADKQMFDRFFASDVLYTRSAGATTTKAEIMRSLDEPPDPKAPAATFTAEDVTVHQYGDIAIVAFKLVQKVSDGAGNESRNEFRNTGTFQKRKGKWQAIAWQATKVPPKEQPK
ncbi:MAG: nuclear transport factor 2 family protein [Candidatus Koribacter versatilis]|uniref:Nuclear transport factor 2 family protein n=1 Tax=Candidatus Korobacter versatilis TaxID=658062 RepID=A0A932AAI6_9BACT|nr:nuclear transport factor 2 family protein [Candidatus Koribacter versatilis]